MTRTVLQRAGQLGLLLGLPETGMPEIIAFGQGVEASAAAFWPTVDRSSRINGMDIAVPSAVLLPTGGLGHFGWPALAGHRAGRDFILQFTGWNAEEANGGTVLSAADPIAEVEIRITLHGSESGVLSVASALTNRGKHDYHLDRMMAASFLMPAGETSLTHFTGMWGREFQLRNRPLGSGLWVQESRRGRTSHDRFPYLFLSGAGQEMGFHLGWSGNHLIAIDTLDDGRRLVHLGELFEPGEMILKPGETYRSPTSHAGMNTNAFHAYLRKDVLNWPGGTMRPRPVTLNTWEGNYFDHRPQSLMAQADAAAALGIERFVLDDGWFGRRDDDTTSLGDWFIDKRKYPEGLKPLVDHVRGLGMEFGIWFEPEMVNPVSDLYKAHPEWVLQVNGRPLLTSRNQLVLDLTRPEVSEYLFEAMAAVLRTLSISYIKWDMNRDLTHAGGAQGQARIAAQTRSVLALMQRMRDAFPDVEIESCASGGGRIDFGVLRHTHRVWTSDCTDAFERLEIQRGASLFLAPEILGAHIAASPNHQTHRRLTLSFRALVALAYHLGVELNPLELADGERAELAGWIALHKRLRPLLHAPGASFQLPPLDGRYVWGAGNRDKLLVFVLQGTQMVSEQPPPLTLSALPEDETLWRIAAVHPAMPDFIRMSEGQKKLLSGDVHFSAGALARAGLPLPMLRPESGMLLEIEPVKRG